MDPLDNPCTCGYLARDHDRTGACHSCPCPDFTSDDVAVAEAVGVLERNRPSLRVAR